MLLTIFFIPKTSFRLFWMLFTQEGYMTKEIVYTDCQTMELQKVYVLARGRGAKSSVILFFGAETVNVSGHPDPLVKGADPDPPINKQ
jgi:hypothetical protein